MNSKLMTKDEIVEYVYNNVDYFSSIENLTCEEIGDGNINYIFKVIDRKEGKSLIVKQSDVYLRSSGRPLDINRNNIEARMLEIEYNLYPSSVPKIYLYDKENALIVMEDISAYKNLRTELMEGHIYTHFANSISEFFYRTLIPTTDIVISRKEKKDRVKEFINPDLCDISEDLVFTEPYYNYKNRNIITDGLEGFVEDKLYNNLDLKCEVLKLKDKFQTSAQGLIHGDLHSGSIFINETGIKVIDPEFAFYGPIGYDIGNVWGNLFFSLSYITLNYKNDSISNINKSIIDTVDLSITRIRDSYEDFVENIYYKNAKYMDYFVNEIIADSFGYAGTEIIRRVVGDSKVAELDSIIDNHKRLIVDKTLIEFSIYLIENRYEIKDGKEIVKIYKKIYDDNCINN